MFKVAIETDNAAFEEGRGAELARILRDLAWKLENGQEIPHPGDALILRDVNGNRVGAVTSEEI